MGEETGSNAVSIGKQIGEQLWRQEEQGEVPRAMKRVCVGIQINESFSRLWDEDEDLLPGLPNDITLHEIVPKLPWVAFYDLSSVCHTWLQAIRSHKVHDARVRANSTAVLAVMKSCEDDTLILYSMPNGNIFLLPCIAQPNEGAPIPMPESCVPLNGRIYVLGGKFEHNASKGCNKVYMLDLAGQREWRQCASMQHRRAQFGYGAKDGEIYVFGGAHCGNPVRGCEVYNPKQNSWSAIAPMEFWRHRHKVASFGEELFVFGGFFYGGAHGHSRAWVMDAYHPIKNKWRRVGEHPHGRVFMALGKFHVMTQKTIDVYDHQKNTWSHLHSINLGNFSFDDEFLPYDIIATNDELLVASWNHFCGDYHFFKGKGLGGKNAEILFQLEESGPSNAASFPCTIQL